MKTKITLLALLMFAGIISTQAQGFQKRTVEERTKMMVDRMSDSLKLSKPQQADVDSVFAQYYKNQDKLRDGLAPGTRPEKADMDKLFAERDAKLKIILTEPQYNKYMEMQAAMRTRQRPPGQ